MLPCFSGFEIYYISNPLKTFKRELDILGEQQNQDDRQYE